MPKTASYSIAIIFFIFIFLTFFFNDLKSKDLHIIFIGPLLFFFVGYLDDRFQLSALNKIILLSVVSLGICLFSEKFIIYKFYLVSFDFFFNLNLFQLSLQYFAFYVWLMH